MPISLRGRIREGVPRASASPTCQLRRVQLPATGQATDPAARSDKAKSSFTWPLRRSTRTPEVQTQFRPDCENSPQGLLPTSILTNKIARIWGRSATSFGDLPSSMRSGLSRRPFIYGNQMEDGSPNHSVSRDPTAYRPSERGRQVRPPGCTCGLTWMGIGRGTTIPDGHAGRLRRIHRIMGRLAPVQPHRPVQRLSLIHI